MGWARTLFLGDIGNRLDIADTEEEIRHMQSLVHASLDTDRAQDVRIASLERENEELKLYLASLVRLLVSHKVLSEEELRRLVDVIDGAEGAEG